MKVVGTTVSHGMSPTNSGGDNQMNLVMHCHNLKNTDFLYMHSSCKFRVFIDAVRISNY